MTFPEDVPEEVTKQYIVIVGNPFDGFDFHGTFDTFEYAEGYADALGVMGDWWIATLDKEVIDDPREPR